MSRSCDIITIPPLGSTGCRSRGIVSEVLLVAAEERSASGLDMAFHAKTQAICSFLQAQAAARPDLATEYTLFEDLFTRKLWHQLTVGLEAFVVREGVDDQLIPLYETFIMDFKQKLNKLVLARLLVPVARQMTSQPAELISFCEAAIEECQKEDKQAGCYVVCELARMLLDMDRVEECKAKLEVAAQFVEGTAGIDNTVQASYCRAQAAYFKVRGRTPWVGTRGLLLRVHTLGIPRRLG